MELEIAALLNAEGVRTDLERAWTRGTIHQILINEKYIGNNVWNRGSFKLKHRRVRNEPDMWIRAESVFEPIVDRITYDAAQAIIATRSYRLSDGEMLSALRRILERHGYLSGLIIDETDNCPSSSAFQSRFGSLLRTYSLIGYNPGRDYSYVEINRRLRRLYPVMVEEVIDRLREIGALVDVNSATDLLTINGEITASLILSRCRETAAGAQRWVIRIDTGLSADITIAVRMQPGEQAARDYYLLPAIDLSTPRLRLAVHSGASLDVYRFETLDALYDLAKRTKLKDIF